MHTHAVTGDQTVADVLARYPQLCEVFFRHHMACVGCTFAAFETIHEVAGVYGFTSETLLQELHADAQYLDLTSD